MRRRDFILAGGAIVAWPLVARAQESTVPAVGFLNSASADGYASMAAAFKKGLKEAGYADGHNLTIDTAGQITGTSACRHLRPTWWTVGST